MYADFVLPHSERSPEPMILRTSKGPLHYATVMDVCAEELKNNNAPIGSSSASGGGGCQEAQMWAPSLSSLLLYRQEASTRGDPCQFK